MGKRLAILTLLAAIFAASSAGPAAAAPVGSPQDEQHCRYPNPYAVIGDVAGVTKVEYLPVNAGWGLRWLLISIDGPPSGAAYVLSCDGRVIAKQALGFFVQAQPGPSVDRHNTLQVTYVSASGTGLDQQSVALLYFDGKTISMLWDHPSRNMSSQSNSMLGGAADDYRTRTETEIFDWTLAPSATEIDVTGQRIVALGQKITRTVLPAEKYCYRSQKARFLKCR